MLNNNVKSNTQSIIEWSVLIPYFLSSVLFGIKDFFNSSIEVWINNHCGITFISLSLLTLSSVVLNSFTLNHEIRKFDLVLIAIQISISFFVGQWFHHVDQSIREVKVGYEPDIIGIVAYSFLTALLPTIIIILRAPNIRIENLEKQQKLMQEQLDQLKSNSQNINEFEYTEGSPIIPGNRVSFMVFMAVVVLFLWLIGYKLLVIMKVLFG